MSGGGAGGGKGAGPVPQASRKLVQSLKEIVNRPEPEIYAALRECGMDPDEAVSRLLSQDTFQEVKSKRDKKKEVKETPEPRSRAANNVTSRGVRGVPDRGGRNSSVYHSSIDNTTSRSSVSGPGMPSTNSTQKQTVPSSSVNKNVVADTPSVPPQTSSGFQQGWSGTPGQLSLADIVKMGRPQAQGKPSTKPVVTADKGYAGQYPSLPTTVNQNIKQSASTVPPTELDQGLPSAQDSVLVKDHIHPAADNKQNYDNDWSRQDEPLSGNQSYLPETSGDPSLYEAPLHQSTLVADVGYSHEKSYLDENMSAAVRSVNASERHLDHFGGDSEYNDGLLQNSSAYSHIENQVEESNTDVSAAANFQGLSLHDEELAATKFAEVNPAVIIPDHLQVANTECAGLSFGSFESGAFSGLLPQKSADNNSEVPVVKESEAVDHTDTRDQDFYEIDAVNPSANENLEHIMGANTGNLDAPSVPQPDVMRQEILDDPSAVQYNLPSVSSHGYSNPAQPNAMEAMQGSNQAHTLSHLSSLLQANTLQHNVLGSNMPPRRDLDFGLSPLLAAQAQCMGTRYNSAAPTTTGQAISMQEPLKSGVFSNTQSTQNLPSSSIQTGPPLPQQLVHPYSQPTLPIAPFTNMIGYPYLAAQNYPAAYIPSTAFQQAYSSNGQFHQSAAAVPVAGMKYSMPQYKNMPDTNLQQQQQQSSSVISGYGGCGSSSNLPANFALNQSATPAAVISFDEAMSAQYKAANLYMAALQQQQQQQQRQQQQQESTLQAETEVQNSGDTSVSVVEKSNDTHHVASIPEDEAQEFLLDGAERAKLESDFEKAYEMVKVRKRVNWEENATELFRKICNNKIDSLPKGEREWNGNRIIRDISLEIFYKTKAAYSSKQLFNKWKNMNKAPPKKKETNKAHGKKKEKDHMPLTATCEESEDEVQHLYKEIEQLKINNKEDKEKYAAVCEENQMLIEKIARLKAEFNKVEQLKINNKEDKEKYAAVCEENQMLIEKIARLKAEFNKVEALRRGMLNQILELKGSIRVFCRVRPPLKEDESHNKSILSFPRNGKFVGRRVQLEHQGVKVYFTCDRVFDPSDSQEMIFQEISELVQSALDGEKVCIFAYGQTCSGKTYTMLGADGDCWEDGDCSNGIIPRALRKIFETAESRESHGSVHTIKLSMREIYNNKTRNLSPVDQAEVKTTAEALEALKKGLGERSVAKTTRNDKASRSHFIFELSIYSNDKEKNVPQGILTIIDLAGSEHAETNASEKRKIEDTEINTSLLRLGIMINAIESGHAYINHRDSTLTMELKSSLGKDTKVLMFINVAPEEASVDETIATFDFAARIESCTKTVVHEKGIYEKMVFESPGVSRASRAKDASVRKILSRNNTSMVNRQGPSFKKNFDVAPSCKKRKMYIND